MARASERVPGFPAAAPGRPRHRFALVVLVLLAAVLRLPGLDFGFPGIAHDDEWDHVARGATILECGSPLAQVAEGEYGYINPTGFKLVAAAFMLPVDAWAAGGLPGGEGARRRYRAHRPVYHLAVRLASLLAGALAVGLTFLAGRRLVGARPALLGAALVCVSPLHVRDSHFATNDVALSALAAWVAYLLASYVPWPTRRRALLLGVAVGAAAATKYSGALLLGPAVVGLALAPFRAWLSEEEPVPAQLRDGSHALLLLLGAALAFGLLFPAAFLDTAEFSRSFRYQSAFADAPWPNQEPGPVWLLHARSLSVALGLPGLLLVAVGALLLARRNTALAVAIALHLAVFAGSVAMFGVRFDLPLLPFLGVAGAVAAEAAFRRLPAGWGWGGVVLLGAVLVGPAATSVRIDRLLTRTDTRAELRAYLRGRLAAGEAPRLAIDPGVHRYLPLGEDGRYDPRLEVLLVLHGERRLPAGAAGAALLAERGVDYVVLTSTYLTPQPDADALLRGLGERGRAVRTFDPALPGARVPMTLTEIPAPYWYAWRRARPGPTIWVFRLDGGSAAPGPPPGGGRGR